ncbi:MAG: zinc-ribbon domain-containing protein [Oligoflexia bacterium]|nr:zinc-ribbon domain-containing protein [Oligoflexia bacterium]
MVARLTIEDMRRLAKEKEGKCLSLKYINSKQKLKWSCKDGHIWFSRPSHIKSGSWCPTCENKNKGKNQRHTIGLMQSLAKNRDGNCLSKIYRNEKSKLLWICSEKHTWYAKPSNIKSGNWCPRCAVINRIGNTPYSIEDMKILAKSREGKCLSKKYINSKTKLRWKCKCGHEWEAIPSSVKIGRWCPKCGGRRKKQYKKFHC